MTAQIKQTIVKTIEFIDACQNQTDVVSKIICIKYITSCCRYLEDILGISFETMDELISFSTEKIGNDDHLWKNNVEEIQYYVQKDLPELKEELQLIHDTIYNLGE